MKIDILFDEIQKIQQEYKKLLFGVQEQFVANVNINEIADEISIFWYGRRNIIKLYLQNLPKDNSTYLFTGASYLDIKNKEHYPFITIGTHHIIDDSVSRYLQDIQKKRDSSFDAELKKQTKKAISDDIEILSNYSNVFILIPVRFFVPKQIKLLHKTSSQMYLSIFETPMKTLNEYFSTYTSIDQVFNDIRPKLKQQIIFSGEDSTSETLEKKFERYISLNREISKDKDDVSIFFLAVYGFIAQAIDVLLTTIQYNVVPYIRFAICHHYILLLAPTFILQLEDGEKSCFEDKLMMMTAVHVFYNCFDLTKIEKINFNDYVDIVRSLSFSSNYIEKIKNNFSSATTPKKYINQIAEEELQHMYVVLEK